jgi:hypothetical protein
MRTSDLGEMELSDDRHEHGETRRIDELWRDRPVVLVFIRHFG